jgi:hypothetical protein
MRVLAKLFFAIEKDLVDEMRSVASRLGLTAGNAPGLPGRHQHFKVEVVEERESSIERFCAYLTSRGAKWFLRRDAVYSEDELKNAPLLVFRLERAPRGDGGPTYGTEYDLSSACPVCGTGAPQASSLVLKRSDVPKSGPIFQTLDHEYLVNGEIARSLADSRLTGLRLLEARSLRDGAGLGWFQLIPTAQMPPVAAWSKGLERWKPCTTCGRDGYYHRPDEPLQLAYSTDAALSSLPDVTTTYECFGKSGLRQPLAKSHFAQPMLLVKPRFREILAAHKVRGAQFEPVRFG